MRLLVWIADHAGRRGRGLQAGDIVTTGRHIKLAFAAPTARVDAVFPALAQRDSTPYPVELQKYIDNSIDYRLSPEIPDYPGGVTIS